MPPHEGEPLRALGRALMVLRKRAGMSQAAAAERIGTSTQTWQRYEAGERQLLADPDEQARLARVVGASRDELMAEFARITGAPAPGGQAARPSAEILTLPVHGRPKAGPEGLRLVDAGEATRRIDLLGLLGPNSWVIQMADETMGEWAEPGELIIYDRDRPPRRGRGCVIETLAGELHVKRYLRTQDGRLEVEQLNPRRVLSFDLAELAGVYAVQLRGE